MQVTVTSIQQGNIVIRPIQANFTRDTDLIGKMDPFIIAMMGNQKHRGNVVQDGGKTPFFNDTFVFTRGQEKSVFLEIRDKDDMTANDLIGISEIPLGRIELSGGKLVDWFSVYYKKQPAGQIMVEATIQGQ